ncbi:MAG: hypothetical protein JWL77_5655 [Chthonomonadaceae bacterium]|nr:hypothetical protein [Chthonomonadaceae bacterium]
MAQSQVIEGTTEEIAALLQTGAFAGQKLRVIVEADEEEANTALPDEDSNDPRREQRAKQISALAMRGPKQPKSKDSWLNTVGKHSEDSPLNRIFDEGARIREAERTEQC